jgi:hypothetical protein
MLEPLPQELTFSCRQRTEMRLRRPDLAIDRVKTVGV